MAEYQYRCQGCRHEFMVAHSVHQTAIMLCPLCEDRAEKILTAAPGIVTKHNTQGTSEKADSKGENAIDAKEDDDHRHHGCGCAWTQCFHTTGYNSKNVSE